jgi:hypothetical protein
MFSQKTPAWIPPRPKPEILQATTALAKEYMAWFVNHTAYSRQTDRPDEKSGKYFFYQVRDRQKNPLSLNEEIVRKHLTGERTLGLYAIDPQTQCSKWVAIDADYEGAYRDLRTLKWELAQDGVHAAVEMSRRGAHLWILFEEPLPAKLCRIYIYNLALRLDVPIKGTFKQVDGIEIFPRHDELAPNKYGLAIRAPLGIHRANMHRYWFEDAPGDLPGQMSYLRSVKRLSREEIETFTEGMTIPESVASKPTIAVPYESTGKEFAILSYIRVTKKESSDYRAQCPSCGAKNDPKGHHLAVSIREPWKYRCWYGCTREMIREALGHPIRQRTYR